MRYEDERGYIITIDELRTEWDEIRNDGEHDGLSFGQYLADCTGKNGTLTRID